MGDRGRLGLLVVLVGWGLGMAIEPAIAQDYRSSQGLLNFADWCRQRDRLDPAARHTVGALLRVAKTENCEQAWRNLAALPVLDLSNQNIQDLQPIATFNHWRALSLPGNQIRDLRPLAGMSSLRQLILGFNQVQDLSPLQDLDQLEMLDLTRNQITALPQQPGLARLRSLILLGNPLRQHTCPFRPITVCLFDDPGAPLTARAQAAIDQGNWPEAIAQLQQARDQYQALGDRSRLAKTQVQLGNVYLQLGEFARALEVQQAAHGVIAETGDRPTIGLVMANLTETYERLGQYHQAEAWLDRAIANAAEQSTAAIPLDGGLYELPKQQGYLAAWLSQVQLRQGKAAPAVISAQQGVQFYNLLPEDYPGKAIGMTKAQLMLGEALRAVGRRSEARNALEQVRQLAQTHGDRPGEAQAWEQLALLANDAGDREQARAGFEAALGIHRATGARAEEGRLLTRLGEFYLQQRAAPRAIDHLFQAIARWESVRPGLSDDNKIALADTQAQTYRLLQEALIVQGQAGQALEVAERARARAFVELLAARSGHLANQPSPAASPPPTLSQIQQLARDRRLTLVEYTIGQRSLHIWVVNPQGNVTLRTVAMAGDSAEATLATQIQELRRILPQGQLLAAELRRQLNGLHRQLIAPIADLLPTDPQEPVAIVPQGLLFLVPFAALQAEDGQMLIDRHSLFLTPAIDVLRLQFAETPPDRPLASDVVVGVDRAALVVGNPVMPAVPPVWGAAPSPLSNLPGAESEARQVAQLLQVKPLLGAQATKGEILDRITQARRIHLATHGLLDDLGNSGMPGAIALAPAAGDDGLLSAGEIMELRLAAELVVLSACDTGRGRITGDGVLGLSRSFLAAGADRVVVTLWKIPDEPTAILMGHFYAALQQGSSPVAALRQAMIQTRDRYPNPFQWAAFTAVGRPD